MSLTTGAFVQTQTFLAYETPSQTDPPLSVTITWTNLGPLTTTFTPPSGCSPSDPNLFVFSRDGTTSYETSAPCSYIVTTPHVASLTCQPSGSAFSSFVGTDYSSYISYQTYMSPGLYCPSGYTTGLAVTLGASNATATSIDAYTVQATGTHVFCCQSGYTYQQDQYGCVSTVQTALTTSLCDLLCSGNDCDASDATTASTLATCTTTNCDAPTPFSWTPAQQSVIVQAYSAPVYLIHQQSDLPSDSGLSTGDKAAIGVVVPVVVLAALGIGIWFFMKRKQKKREAKLGGDPVPRVEMQQD